MKRHSRRNKSGMRKLVSAIFSFSFSDIITTKIIKYLHGIGIFVAGLSAIILTFLAFTQSIALGFAALIASIVLCCLFVAAAKVWAETTTAIFEILDILKDITEE